MTSTETKTPAKTTARKSPANKAAATMHCPQCKQDQPVSEDNAFGRDELRATLSCGHVVEKAARKTPAKAPAKAPAKKAAPKPAAKAAPTAAATAPTKLRWKIDGPVEATGKPQTGSTRSPAPATAGRRS